jgi:hypothetical protein
MDPKEKLVIQKLLNIAEKQQKVIRKLAQEQDQNIDYLRRAVQVAGVNANPPVSLTAFVVHKSGGYSVTVDGFPAINRNDPRSVEKDKNLKMSFKGAFDNQLKAQNRTDLLNSLVLIYNNKT